MKNSTALVRAIFLTATPKRTEQIGRLLATNRAYNFIWITDAYQMFRHGIGARIFSVGGTTNQPPQSILGPKLACELPFPKNSRITSTPE
jgi:hypothetical protein